MINTAFREQRMAVQMMDGAGLSFQYLLRRLARRWWLLLLALILGAITGYGYAAMQTPIYASQAIVLIGAGQSDGSIVSGVIEAEARLAETYAQLAKTQSVLQPVIDTQGLPETISELRSKVATRTIEALPILEIRVTDPEPQRAADLANAVVDALAQRNREQASQTNQQSQAALGTRVAELQSQITNADLRFQELLLAPESAQAGGQGQIDAARAERDRLQASLDRLNTAASTWDVNTAAAEGRVTVWSRASAPAEPVKPQKPLLVFLGGMLGLMAVGGLLVLRAFVDTAPVSGTVTPRDRPAEAPTPS